MTERQEMFFVRGRPKGQASGRLTLRRFGRHEDAAAHALKVNLDVWDDVWVDRELVTVRPEITGPPPMPWSAEWVGGNAYVIDATGKKIACLLGPQKQRELVAGFLCDVTARGCT